MGILLAIAVLAGAPARAAVQPSPSHAGPKLDTVTLAISHRVFHEFRDRQQVRLNEEFQIGDTDYSAKVVRYVPDFAMDLKSHKIFSRTNQPNNPAFQIIVREKKVPQDTTWAMIHMAPHFSMRSFLAFQVLRIDFIGRPPLVADTTSTTSPPPGEHPKRTQPPAHSGPTGKP